MKNITKLFLLFSTLFVFISQTKAATRICTVSGNWSNPATWGGAGIPAAGDNVQIYDGRTVTVDIAGAVCADIWIGLFVGGGTSKLIFLNSSSTLTSTGQTLIGWAGNTNGVIDMANGGTFTSGTWTLMSTAPTGYFIPGIGTNAKVIFTGTFTLPNDAGFDDFNDLEINGGTVTLSRAITVRNLTITSGTLNANGFGITVTGNWTNSGGTFTPGGNTVTFNGTGTQTITHATTETFYNLTTNTTGPLTLATTDVTVTNALTMTAGLYNLNGRTLTLGTLPSGATSTLTRSAGTWMYGGTFKRFWPEYTAISSTNAAAYGLFPMGTSSASNYRPVEINYTGGALFGGCVTNSFYTVTHVDNTGVLNLSPLYNDAGTNIVRIHNAQFITAISDWRGGTYSIDVTMTGIPGGGIVNDIRLARWTGGTTADAPGTHAATTGTTANPTAKRTALNSAAKLTGDFRISTIDAGITPLPVELLYLTPSCSPEGGGVVLKWATASETNNNYFTIDASPNPSEGGGLEWKEIGTVKGTGNSSTIKQYEFTYESPRLRRGKGWAFRLQQTDFNGITKIFAPISVSCSGTSGFSFTVNPNPVSDGNIYVFVNGTADENVLFVLTDVLGRELYSKIIVAQSNGYLFNIILQDKIVSGVYFVTASANDKYFSKKIVIQK